MPESPPARGADAAALRHTARRLDRAAEPPWLHLEIARRMAERLPIVKARPTVVVDASVPWGSTRALLAAAYPQARWIGVVDAEDAEDGASAAQPPGSAAAAGPSRRWWRPWQAVAAPAPARVPLAAVADGSAGLVWANLGLSAAPDAPATLARWQRVLAVDGFLMFSALGPGTLAGLSRAWREAGWPPPFAPFVDMHDLGDALVQAGFADPVMDQETVTLTWADAGAALADLRRWGGNAHPDRFAGCRTPRWRARLEGVTAPLRRADGRLALAFEFVYGHAFKAAPRVPVAAETRLGAADLQAMARRPRAPR